MPLSEPELFDSHSRNTTQVNFETTLESLVWGQNAETKPVLQIAPKSFSLYPQLFVALPICIVSDSLITVAVPECLIKSLFAILK